MRNNSGEHRFINIYLGFSITIGFGSFNHNFLFHIVNYFLCIYNLLKSRVYVRYAL